jgi:hypothetical protein
VRLVLASVALLLLAACGTSAQSSVAAVPTSQPATSATPPALVATPLPTPQSTPPPTPAPTAPPPTAPPPTAPPATPTPVTPSYSCSASMARSSPSQYTDDTVNITSDVPNAPVLVTKHYRTTTSANSGETNAAGADSITFYISGATVGYTVQVDVSINNGQASCSTSFTPQ